MSKEDLEKVIVPQGTCDIDTTNSSNDRTSQADIRQKPQLADSAQSLDHLLREGTPLSEISSLLNIPVPKILDYRNHQSLTDPWRKARYSSAGKLKQLVKKYPGLDQCVLEGMDEPAIAKRYGITRQAVNDILKRHDLRDLRKEAKQERLTSYTAAMTSLVSVLQSIYQARIGADETLRAIVDVWKPTILSITLQQAVEIVAEYRSQCDSGKKVNLSQIGRKVGVHYTKIGAFIDKIPGLPSRPRNRSELDGVTCEQIQAAIHSHSLLSRNDMSSIMGISAHILANHMHEAGIRHKPQYAFVAPGGPRITYRAAMDYFDACDAGFDQKDALKYSNLKESEWINRLVQDRARIESEVHRFQEIVGVRKYSTKPQTQNSQNEK